jgi:tetrapyrrole methylase family protein/MazG family protein
MLEEAYETVDAIDRDDSGDVSEEIGDLYLVLTLVAYIYEQEGRFTIAEVFEKLCEKLVRRHPHVFGERSDLSSSDVIDQWRRIKVDVEGKREKSSEMDKIPSSLPPLERAYKIQKKASKVGFDWPDLNGVLAKIQEEAREVAELTGVEKNAAEFMPERQRAMLELELGDLLFSVVNLARYVGIDASLALNRTNEKFVRRFRDVEAGMADEGLEMTADNLESMDRHWNRSRSEDRDRDRE